VTAGPRFDYAASVSRPYRRASSGASPAGVGAGVERDEITNSSHAACGSYPYPDRGDD
jgi:hypothetical protein